VQITNHEVNGKRLAEVSSTSLAVTAGVLVEAMVNCAYDGCEAMIVHEASLPPGFFELRSGVAGGMLQKFSTYRMRLAIVGDFDKYQSKNLQDFIRESNRMGSINFVPNLQVALDRLGLKSVV
jgi:hypothetical protein